MFVFLLLARMLEKRQGEYLQIVRDIVPMLAVVGVPFLLVMKQPDLGTAIVFFCIYIGMLWVGTYSGTTKTDGEERNETKTV